VRKDGQVLKRPAAGTKNVVFKPVQKKPSSAFRSLGDVQPGFLRRAKVKTQRGRDNYERYSKQFRDFAREHSLPIPEEGCDDDLDYALERFCEYQAMLGHGLFPARSAVYGEAWKRGVNLKRPEVLECARAALSGWAKASPGDSKDPLPWTFACLVADSLYDVRAELEKQAADCLLIQFDTYLRPGVAVELSDWNVILPPSDTSEHYQNIALLLAPSDQAETTKAGEQDDTVLVGTVNPDRKFVAELLTKRHQKALYNGGGALFPLLNLSTYDRLLRKHGNVVGLQKLKLSGHLARHGGPSTDAMEKRLQLADIQKRGCWKTFTSVMRYEKHARLMKVLNSVGADVRAKAAAAAKRMRLKCLQEISGSGARSSRE
jgi:hypothetical protein